MANFQQEVTGSSGVLALSSINVILQILTFLCLYLVLYPYYSLLTQTYHMTETRSVLSNTQVLPETGYLRLIDAARIVCRADTM